MTDKKSIVENKNRENLRILKPIVYDKVLKLEEKFNNGESTAIICIGYDFKCNLKCKHCFIEGMKKAGVRKLDVADITELSKQADEMGLWQFNISGGEPMLYSELDDIIKAINPSKFYLTITTNGILLDYGKAKHLKEMGVDKIAISLDSINEMFHNQNRNANGAYKKTVDAIFAAKEAGLKVLINTVITKQNAKSDETERLAQFAFEKGFALDMLVAKPIGNWEGRFDLLVDDDSAEYLKKLHEKYPVAGRDIYPAYGLDYGCNACTNNLYINPYGDVCPCTAIPISLGNIFDESLRTIVDRGLSLKPFRNYSKVCLAGEDTEFIKKYLSKTYGKKIPVKYDEIFTEEDYIYLTS